MGKRNKIKTLYRASARKNLTENFELINQFVNLFN
jgi:hypothetical protein